MPEPGGTEALFAGWRQRVDAALADALPDPSTEPARLHAAMRHAVLQGGKRVRPLLVYAVGTAIGVEATRLDRAAAAVELIHAYSLVHDDLPAMDDDALRRGQPTVHVAFDEATAILAGDALQSLAFELLADAPFDAEVRVALLAELARAAGVRGMCGGQALDIAATAPQLHPPAIASGAPQRAEGFRLHEDPATTIEQVERLHAMKTGALLRASVRLGAIAARADDEARARLDRFADTLGLAFQVRDDLLDVEGDAATLGKSVGKDAAQDKATFPALIGIDGTRAKLDELAATMTRELDGLPADTIALAALAGMVVRRTH